MTTNNLSIRKTNKEHFLQLSAKEIRNSHIIGEAVVSRLMRLLKDGNKTQKKDVLLCLRDWLNYNDEEMMDSVSLSFQYLYHHYWDFEEETRLSIINTFHKLYQKQSTILHPSAIDHIQTWKKKEPKPIQQAIKSLVVFHTIRTASKRKVIFQPNEEQRNQIYESYAFQADLPSKFKARKKNNPSLQGLKKNSPEEGYVYFIEEKFSQTIKIGKTKDLTTRTNLFNVKLPFEWEVKHVIQTANYHQLEKDLHAKFKSKRTNGEWFRLDESDWTYIHTLSPS